MPNVLLPTTASRAVQIDFFCKSIVEINGESKTHLLVSLAWFKPHPKSYELGKPTTVWYHDLFELHGFHSIIPVQFLTSRAVSLIEQLDNESVLFVCPCIDFLCSCITSKTYVFFYSLDMHFSFYVHMTL